MAEAGGVGIQQTGTNNGTKDVEKGEIWVRAE